MHGNPIVFRKRTTYKDYLTTDSRRCIPSRSAQSIRAGPMIPSTRGMRAFYRRPQRAMAAETRQRDPRIVYDAQTTFLEKTTKRSHTLLDIPSGHEPYDFEGGICIPCWDDESINSISNNRPSIISSNDRYT